MLPLSPALLVCAHVRPRHVLPERCIRWRQVWLGDSTLPTIRPHHGNMEVRPGLEHFWYHAAVSMCGACPSRRIAVWRWRWRWCLVLFTPNAKRWPRSLAGRDDSAGEGSSGMWSRCAATRHDFIQRCMGRACGGSANSVTSEEGVSARYRRRKLQRCWLVID